MTAPARLAADLRRDAAQVERDAEHTTEAGIRQQAAADAEALRRRADELEQS